MQRTGQSGAPPVALVGQRVLNWSLLLFLFALTAGPLWAAPPKKGTSAPPSPAGRGARKAPAGMGPIVPIRPVAPVAADGRATLAVDVVELADGPPVRGLILHRTSSGDLVLVVDREWLQTADPDRLRSLTQAERQLQPRAWRELVDRLRVWRSEPSLADRLQSFLDAELVRGEALLARWTTGWKDEDFPPFVWVDLPAQEIRRVRGATAGNRQIALVAWRENLAGVCTKTAVDLAGELNQLGIQPDSERVNLADRLPPRLQTENEWQARRAVLGYIHQQSLDFQGTASQLMQTGPGAPAASAGELLAAALQSQLSQAFSELLNPEFGERGSRSAPFTEGALARCREKAHQLTLRGYRATAVHLDATAGQTRVESRFEVRLGPGEWVIAWQGSRQGGPARATPEARQRLREDPQVGRVLDLLAQAGLAGDDAVERALEAGLATQVLQQDLEAEFRLFLGHYGLHAEGPPLFLPEAAPR